MSKKYFPIRTDTACQWKWSWSTLYLNGGFSRTCHRTAQTTLTSENFSNFHNTDLVMADRERMLQGLWPEESCSYCRTIEEIGGTSDRLRVIDIPDLYPAELDSNPKSLVVTPTIVEVYFDNTCNLGCLYCAPSLSSVINEENKKFGKFEKNGVVLSSYDVQTSNLIESFWKWFPEGFPKLKRLGVLGGEPLYQKEFDQLLDMIDRYPNPACELNIVTNLMAKPSRVEGLVKKLKDLVLKKKVGRIDITCSIDCWGPEQEYVRYGLALDQWEKNFNILLENKWIYLNVNNTVTVLTIKTLPELLQRLARWGGNRKIHHHFSGPVPGPSYFNGGILGGAEFAEDFAQILSLMPKDTAEDQITYQYMEGLSNFIISGERNPDEICKLFTYLDEKDRRRNTSWQETFPWLVEYKKYVV
jgi:hypothetical protein